MKLKQTSTVVLSSLLAVSLAACSSNTKPVATPADAPKDNKTAAPATEELKPEPGAKLVVWDGGDQKAFVEEVAKAFKAKYNVDVTFTEVGADKSVSQMITDGPAGVGADVFAAVHDRVGSAVGAGILLPNDFFEADAKKESFDTAIKALSDKGVLYGYPKAVETTAVYYNKDIIKEVPKTWDELIKFAQGYNDPKNNKFAYMWEAGNGYWSYGFFGGYGTYVFGKDGTDAKDIGLNNDKAVEAAKFFQSLKTILPLKTSDINGDIKKSLFEQKKLAMNVSGPWDKESLKKVIPNLGVAPYPTLANGKPMMPFSGVKGYFVSANSKYPKAARLFARMATSAEFQKKNYELSGLLPANKTLAEDPAIKNDPITIGFLKQFENSVPMPSIPEMAQYWAPMEAALGSLWNDNKDPKATMDNLVKQMKDNIAAGK